MYFPERNTIGVMVTIIINLATWVQNLDEAFSVSLYGNSFGKGRNQSVLALSSSLSIVEKSGPWLATSLGGGKILNLNQWTPLKNWPLLHPACGTGVANTYLSLMIYKYAHSPFKPLRALQQNNFSQQPLIKPYQGAVWTLLGNPGLKLLMHLENDTWEGLAKVCSKIWAIQVFYINFFLVEHPVCGA